MTDQEFLISLGVFKRNRVHATPDYQLTTGGLLFFGKYESIRDRFPHFQLDYFRYNTNHDHDWIDRVSTGDLHYPELNVYSFYRIVSEKLPAGVMDPFTQDERQTRTSYAADLRQAMKEALVNCLMHPYYDGETSVKIRDREHYTEFINPGTMRVSPESFARGAESLTRNNVIAGLFRKIGIAERAASGGPRIFQSAMKNRLHTPDLLMNDTTTTLRIWKVDILASLSGAEQLTTQEQAVLKVLEAAEFRPYKLNELIKEMARLRYSDYAIRKAVNSLVSKNILSTYGRTKNKVYYLSLSNEAGMIENFRLLKLIENLEMGYRRSNTK